MKFNKLTEISQNLAAQMDNEKPFLTSVLQNKLAKLAERYPNDQTIIQMAQVFNKMGEKSLITKKAELVNIYNRFYTVSSMAGELLKEEIGDQEINFLKPKYAEKQDGKVLSLYGSADPVLQNLLSSVFSGEEPKAYSEEVATKALNQTKTVLNLHDLPEAQLSVASGNEQYIIVNASFTTPRGKTVVFIPVKTKEKRISSPEVFLGNNGAEKISKASLTSYLLNKAGSKLNVTASVVLDLVTEKTEKLSQPELAVAALKIKKAEEAPKTEVFNNSILTTFYPEAKEVPQLRLEEADTFEEKLASAKGAAEITFGTSFVNKARDLVDQALKQAGEKYNQIKVAKSDKSSIYFAVSTGGGRLSFTVPVKVKEGKALKPSVLICEGSISPISEKTLIEMSNNGVFDKKSAAFVSPQYGMKNSELIEIVRQAALDSNFDRAEDAMNIILQSGDNNSYTIAVKEYMSNLNAKKEAAPKSTCSLIVKSKTSLKPVCGHLNLPIDKVVQDKFGNCCAADRNHETVNNPTVGFFYNKIFI